MSWRRIIRQLALVAIVLCLVTIFLRSHARDGAPFQRHENASPSSGSPGLIVRGGTAREIRSRHRSAGTYFDIKFGDMRSYNPNIVPHPSKPKTYVVMAMRNDYGEKLERSEQYACEAKFTGNDLICTSAPQLLHFQPPVVANCSESMARYSPDQKGPRDGRLFYGVDGPYVLYGSLSVYTCLGLWFHDAERILPFVSWPRRANGKDSFPNATEITRPKSLAAVQKNFFVFWDFQGNLYAHFDIFPERSFAQINAHGASLDELPKETSGDDKACMKRLMPELRNPDRNYEDIHQASNSLSITLCDRSDKMCVAGESNTFVMHIFHFKTCYGFHSVYEPYIVLFSRKAPFKLHGISSRSLWIHGRTQLTLETGNPRYAANPAELPQNHTEMFYITSMSWQDPQSRYHGYMDDTVLLSFGIEDSKPAGIDVKASDLLIDLAYC